MSRSLIRQLEQIRRSATYDDAVSNVYTSGVAEPTVSGSLQEDLNVLRTLMKELKGTTDWFGDLGNYFDPSDTDAGNTENKDLNLTNIKNNTLDAKTVLMPVLEDNSAAGYTVSGTTAGVLVDVTTAYATPTDRRGLPIYASTANNGSYHDEGGLDRVVRVDVLDMATDSEMQDSSGNIIYAKMHDGADFSGSGSGTDVYMKFYANDVVCDLSDVQGGAPSAIKFIYPQRKLLSSMAEYDWLRTDFVSSWEGDVELMEDIQNIWSFTGASDNDGSAGPWNNTTANYLLNGDPSSLKAAIDAINDGIGDVTFTSSNYVTDGDIVQSIDDLDSAVASNASAISSNSSAISSNSSAISSNASDITSLQQALGSSTEAGIDYSANNYVTDATDLVTAVGALDTALKTVEDNLTAAAGDKRVESVSTQIEKNVEHPLPYSLTYTPSSTAGQEGANMDVYIDGQLLAADTGVDGVNADRDYGETSTSGITFRFTVQQGRNITYMVRQ